MNLRTPAVWVAGASDRSVTRLSLPSSTGQVPITLRALHLVNGEHFAGAERVCSRIWDVVYQVQEFERILSV